MPRGVSRRMTPALDFLACARWNPVIGFKTPPWVFRNFSVIVGSPMRIDKRRIEYIRTCEGRDETVLGTVMPEVGQARQLTVPLTSNHEVVSPLRYPGGKSVLFGFIKVLIEKLEMSNPTYVEPYAGGAGVALRLLKEDCVSRIVINDYDQDVFAFWNSAVNHSAKFLEKFDDVEPTLEEWRRQKKIIRDSSDEIERGFAFFFLNRTNRSGVINGGVIGGLNQAGKYKVWARYNKEKLREKLVFLGGHVGSIEVTCHDGRRVAEEYASQLDTFVYLDPPYVEKGGSLYLNAFDIQQHQELAETLKRFGNGTWMLTYDDTELIRSLYKESPGGLFPLRYSAASRRRTNELMIFSNALARSMGSLA